MNPFEMVVLIVAIVAVAGIVRTRGRRDDAPGSADPAEADRLRAEVGQLRERLHVLERIVTDGERDGAARLDREIEALRREDRR